MMEQKIDPPDLDFELFVKDNIQTILSKIWLGEREPEQCWP